MFLSTKRVARTLTSATKKIISFSDVNMSSTPKRRNRCVIKSCRRRNEMQNDKESGITFFKVPRSSLHEWRALVPSLGKTSHLCSRHFDEADIIKGQIIGIDNKFYPYLRWQLKTGALPKHCLEESKETKPQVKKSKLTEVQDQPKISKAIKSLPDNLQGQQQVKKVRKSKDQSIERTVLQSLSPNKQTPSLKKNLPSQPINNQECIFKKIAQVDHDYALPLHEEINIADELQDSLSQFDLHSNVPVTQMDNNNVESTISHQMCSTVIAAEDQVDHDYAMLEQGEEQPKNPINPISHPELLSSAPELNFAESVEIQVSATSTSDVIAPTYVVDEAAFRCFSSYVKLPSQFSWVWSLNKKDNILSCTNCSLSTHGSLIIKTVRIISESSVSLFLNGNTIAPEDMDLNFSTYQELSALIQIFNGKRYCEGIPQSSLKDVQVSGRVSGVKELSGRWRSKHCVYLADSIYKTVNTCSKCKQLKKYLKRRSINLLKKKEDKEKAKQTFRMYRRKISTLEKLNTEKSVEIKTWRRDFRKLYTKWKRKLQEELNPRLNFSQKKLENPAVNE